MNTIAGLQKIFPSINDEPGTEYLSKVTNEYPYFSIAQLCFLHQSKKDQSFSEKQAAKTALFFNNIHWLNWQLNSPGLEATHEETENNHSGGMATENFIEAKGLPVTEIIPTLPSIQDDIDFEPLQVTEPGGEQIYETINRTVPIQEEQAAFDALQVSESNDESLNNPINVTASKQEDEPAFNASQFTQAKEVPINETTNDVPPVKEDEIAFEPLHTVDYFASLGIKLSEEPIATDKLGTQMKSFTEWLKSMKKIHTDKLAPADEQTDRKIQNIAEDSNTSTEVVTEAMADVLVKQNKIEKAIEMYRQLSLINPLKSTYFAGKIESLSGDRQI